MPDSLPPLPPRPRIGVAVIVIRHGQVLVGRRLSESHGHDTWQFPGGHLEFGESVEACATREVAEEAGLTITDLSPGPYTNDRFTGEDDEVQKHYVTLFVVARSPAGDAQTLEPHKCAEWRWCAWDALPTPRFLPIDHLLATGYRPPGC